MRKNLKSLAPTLWIVIAAFIIAIFAVWGGAGRLGESRAANTIATVGGEQIHANIYYQNLRQRLEMIKREFKELDRNFILQLNLPQQVLDQIIQQSLLMQKAREMKIYALNEEVLEKIKSYPVFQRNGKFVGFEEYKRILDWNRISVVDFEESLRKEIVLEKLLKLLTSGISVTKDEIWENYKNKNESAKVEYVVAETEKIEFEEEIPSSKIREYFEKNPEKFKIPEKREGDYFFVGIDDLKNEIEIKPEEIESYYKQNISHFKEPETMRVSRIFIPYEEREKELVKGEAQNILEKLKAGEDFSEMAKKYSKDEKAAQGGDWGFFEWKKLSSQEQEQISHLESGENSEIVELEDGLSILKITEKKPEVIRPLEEVSEKIKTILIDKKARELAEKEIIHLEKSARREKSLDVAAQRLGKKIRKTGLLKEGEGIREIDASGEISRTLFSLKEKEISTPIYTYSGVALVQLRKIEPERAARIEEVEDEIRRELMNIEKGNKALKIMKKLKEELKEQKLDDLANKYHLEYRTIEEHKRGQYASLIGENSEFDRLSFSLPLGEASEPFEYEKGYALVRVLERKEVSLEELEKKAEEEKKNLLEEKKNKFLHSYLSLLRNEKGVKIKYDLFSKINSDILSRYEKQE